MDPLVIVSDIHLGHRQCDDVASDLARLVDGHPQYEIVLNGDTFNLSCDPWERDPAASAAAMLSEHQTLLATLGRHLRNGSPVTLIAGNHDAALALPAVRTALLGLLTAGADADLRIEPWFIRRGDVHIEHGHLYDPGNSPTHPLAVPSPRTEPVGVELTRRFIGPYDAWALLADQWAATNADNLKLMFRLFGARTPVAILHYCAILMLVNAEAALPSRLTGDLARGDADLAAHAARTGVTEARLRALVDARPRPIHFGFWDTFLRFRFDGLLAALAIPAGGLAGLLMSPAWGATLSAIGLGYLVAARRNLAFRGANHMPAELRAGALAARRCTGAKLVILGHTHLEDDEDGYLNLGAFGDRPHPVRTYVHVDANGKVERRALARHTMAG